MRVRTCLLVTDDLDDHHAMSEALSIVSQNTVILNVIDSQKALILLKERAHVPDYVILDLSMHGIKINSILKALRDDNAALSVPTVVYGLSEDFSQIDESADLIFFDKEFKFTELVQLLIKVVVP